jgi:hypothetical protein
MTRTPTRFNLSAPAALLLGALAVLGIIAARSVWAPVTHAQESWSQQERDFVSPETVTPSILL